MTLHTSDKSTILTRFGYYLEDLKALAMQKESKEVPVHFIDLLLYIVTCIFYMYVCQLIKQYIRYVCGNSKKNLIIELSKQLKSVGQF